MFGGLRREKKQIPFWIARKQTWTCVFKDLFNLDNIFCMLSFILKRTVSVISSDPTCTANNTWFTPGPFTAESDQVWIRYQCCKMCKFQN